MLRLVPFLNSEGNYLLTEQLYRRSMMRRSLENLLCPIVLTYCQCVLKLKEYNKVLEHTTELIRKHKDNVKAHYRRGKSHAALFNDKEGWSPCLAPPCGKI